MLTHQINDRREVAAAVAGAGEARINVGINRCVSGLDKLLNEFLVWKMLNGVDTNNAIELSREKLRDVRCQFGLPRSEGIQVDKI